MNCWLLNCKSQILGLLIIMCLAPSSIWAQGDPAAFSQNNLGPRSSALGNSFTAISHSPESLYFNPAGLAREKKANLHFNTYQDLETNYIGTIISFPKFPFHYAIGYTSAAINGIQETSKNNHGSEFFEDDQYFDNGNSFSYKASVLYLNAAAPLIWNNASIGVSLKEVTEKLHRAKAKGVGMDLGIQVKAKLPFTDNPLDFGIAAENIIAPEMKWNTTGNIKEELPKIYKLGISLKLFKEQVTIVSDLRQKASSNDEKSNSLGVGIEYKLAKTLSLRVGNRDGNLSAGAGLKLHNLSLDYAISIPQTSEKEVRENTSKFSISIKL